MDNSILRIVQRISKVNCQIGRIAINLAITQSFVSLSFFFKNSKFAIIKDHLLAFQLKFNKA